MAECRNRILLKLAFFQDFCYTGTIRKAVSMCQKFTPEQLNSMDHETKNDVIYQMQDRLDKLEHDYENLLEQIRLANRQRFGRHTEKPDEIAGQLSFFNEAEGNFDEKVPEPTIEETVAPVMKPHRKRQSSTPNM